MEVDDDFDTDDQLGMAELYELDAYTFDNADAFVELDGHQGVECVACHRIRCWHCAELRPCACDNGGEFSRRETRQMFARAGFKASRAVER